MEYHYSKKIDAPFAQAVDKITEALKKQGFGVITSIDLKDTLKQKLDINFRNYKIIGACNPQFAHKAVTIDSHIGVMLPCNVVIQELDNGEVEITAINPVETIGKTMPVALTEIAVEITSRLRTAVDSVHWEEPDTKKEKRPGKEHHPA